MGCLVDRIYLCVYISHTEKVCPALVDIGNGTVNTTLAIYGVVVEAVCDEGHHFSKGITVIVARCLNTGQWSQLLTECRGMYAGSLYDSQCENNLCYVDPNVFHRHMLKLCLTLSN